MKTLVRYFIHNSLIVKITILLITGGGILAAFQSRKESFPEISLNRIMIRTIYPGASSRDVEMNVTVPLERELEQVEGIEEIRSVSEESVSLIEIDAEEDATDEEFRRLYSDIENAVLAAEDLPSEIRGRPQITDFTSADMPVMEIAFTGEYSILKPYLTSLENRLLRTDGISGIDLAGVPDQEVHILVDSQKAKKRSVDLRMIAAAVRKRNLEGSGGTVESFIGEKKIVILNKFEDYRDVLETNILMNAEGYGVRLKDVADVKMAPEDKKLIVRNNGKHGASMSLRKKGRADLIETISEVRRILDSEKIPDGVRLQILSDQSRLTANRINLLLGNAAMGFVLVLAVLLYIFDVRTAGWTAFGIPFTLLGMLLFLRAAGMSLNLISLAGFVILIGMIVDDAVVIAEEINSNREQGMDSAAAAEKAVSRLWKPVFASSATTIAAFTPLFSLGGFPGKFIWAIPLMIIVGLAVSLAESFFFLPVHLAESKTGIPVRHSFIVKIEDVYRKILKYSLNHRYKVLLILFALTGISLILLRMGIKKDPFPQDASEEFSIVLKYEAGITAAENERRTIEVENIIAGLPGEELSGFSTRIGTLSEFTGTDRGVQNNLAVLFVYLTPYEKRDRKASEIIESVQKKLQELRRKIHVSYSVNMKRIGPPMGKAVDVRIISNDEAIRQKKSMEVISYLEQIPGVQEIEIDRLEGLEELKLVMNQKMLSSAGLTVEDLVTTLRIAYDGLIVTGMSNLEKDIDFRLRLKNRKEKDEAFIENLFILNPRGYPVRLSSFVQLESSKSEASIRHINGQRSTAVYANVSTETISPVEVMEKVQKKFSGEHGYEISFAGQPVETNKIFSGLQLSAAIAVFFIYLIMTLMFSSFRGPFLILLSLPFLVIGLSFVLVTHQIPASMMAGIAMVGLMGVVVNTGIVMVHTVQSFSVFSLENLIEGAVSRLRPIFLTTMTTVLGVLPTGYGIGGYDPFLSHMSLVLAWGLLFSTGITLIVIPVFFMIGEDIKTINKRKILTYVSF
ncbi:MAG: efflux RND transporter permease subunit [Spirochaetia bacterium]|nr:efflux RND transporter permease subunit [Spirochaetia bacterium]